MEWNISRTNARRLLSANGYPAITRLGRLRPTSPMTTRPGPSVALQAYRALRGALTVPVVTVEVSRNGSFDLDSDSADILIRVQEDGACSMRPASTTR